MRVLVTRPQAQAAEWVARLQALGVAAAAVPLLGIDGPAYVHAVRRAWAGLAQHRAGVFVTPHAGERFFSRAGLALFCSRIPTFHENQLSKHTCELTIHD